MDNNLPFDLPEKPIEPPSSVPSPQANPLSGLDENQFSQSIPSVTIDTSSSPALTPQQNLGYSSTNTDNNLDKKSKKKLTIGIILGLFLFFAVSMIGGIYAVAYEKIDLGSSQFQSKVSSLVMSLPFTPKTSKYILARMVDAQSHITKHSFDASASFEMEEEFRELGLDKLDFKTSGKVDYTDPNNILLDSSISLARGLNVNFKNTTNDFYFNLESVPDFVLTLLNMNGADLTEIINTWVNIDTTEYVDEVNKEFEDYKVANGDKYKLTDIPTEVSEIIQSIEVEKMDTDGHKVWYLHKTLTPSEIDTLLNWINNEQLEGEISEFDNKPSDSISTLSLEMMVDQSDYYLRMFSLNGSYKLSDSYSSVADESFLFGIPSIDISEGSFGIIVNLDDFGEDIIVDPPTDYISMEEFGERLIQVFESSYESKPIDLSTVDKYEFAKYRDDGRKQLIQHLGFAVEAYYSSHNGEYPDPRKSSDAWITANLVKSGELTSVPQAISYESGGSCNAEGPSADVENGWCYKTQNYTDGPVIIYTALESELSLKACDVGFPWYVWSSVDRNGLVCSIDEPNPGPQEFVSTS